MPQVKLGFIFPPLWVNLSAYQKGRDSQMYDGGILHRGKESACRLAVHTRWRLPRDKTIFYKQDNNTNLKNGNLSKRPWLKLSKSRLESAFCPPLKCIQARLYQIALEIVDMQIECTQIALV